VATGATHLAAGVLKLTSFRMAWHALPCIFIVLSGGRKARSKMSVENFDRLFCGVGGQTFTSFLLWLSESLVA